MRRRVVDGCLVALLVGATSLAFAAAPKPKPKRPRKRRPSPALAPIEDQAGLPRALLIGDSISIGYTLPTRKLLAGKVNVHRPRANCGPTTRGLQSIDQWLGDGKWDVIHFNWGLHDLKYMGPKRRLATPETGKQQVPIDQYAKNLEQLVLRLKKTGAKLIWASTTPVPEGAGGRVKGDDVKYNAVAAKIMARHGVAIDDLYAFAIPQLDKIQRPKNVHFSGPGSQALAEQVAKSILHALGK